jgi:hypothetical protein
MIVKVLIAAASSALAAGSSMGSISSVSGAVALISPPVSTALNATESDTAAWAFDEVQGYTLPVGIAVNATLAGSYLSNGSLTPGVIPAGSVVNSHYIYADPFTGGTFDGTVIFNQPIIGVIVLRSELNASDAFLGAPGTIYADNSARGMELNANADRFQIDVGLFEIRFRFSTGTATDDIRVLTIPAPATAGLVSIAALAAVRRRR